MAQPKQPASSDSFPIDAEGDVIVKRRRREKPECDLAIVELRRHADGDSSCKSCGQSHSIVIHHAMATSLEFVGKQVWRGAALLADMMLSQPQLVRGRCVVELGAGTGLAGISAACAASNVLLTDLPAMLPICQINVDANASSSSEAKSAAEVAAEARTSVAQHQGGDSGGGADIDVLPLDWSDLPPLAGCPCLLAAVQGGMSTPVVLQAAEWAKAHGWSMLQLCRLQHAQVVLAADCIYDNDLTIALMAAAAELLAPCACSPGDTKLMYVALEKRWNFTLRDMDSRAAAYDFWRTLFRVRKVTHADQQAQKEAQPDGLQRRLACIQLDVRAIRSVLEYERGCDLEMWQLSSGIEV